MTTTAPGAHPPPEEVDALLDPSGGDARVGAHVAACGRCTQVRDGLLQVRALLGAEARSLPPEPADLGARIAAALAAEPPLVPARPAVQAGPTVVSLDERRRRPWTTWLAAAASVAVLGAGGTFLVTQLAGGGSDAAGSAAEAPAMAPQDSSGGDGLEQAPVTPSAEGTLEGSAAARDRGLLSSGTDYVPADLAAQARSLLDTAQVPSQDEAVPDGGPAPEPGYEVSSESALDACLVAVGRPGAEPVVTDLATFEGQRAAVVVIAQGGGYEVLVVPAGCGAGQDRVLASVRLP